VPSLETLPESVFRLGCRSYREGLTDSVPVRWDTALRYCLELPQPKLDAMVDTGVVVIETEVGTISTQVCPG
jgi:hypothetical protein